MLEIIGLVNELEKDIKIINNFKNNMQNKLYNMKCGEVYNYVPEDGSQGYQILRVPGGWVVTYDPGKVGGYVGSVFVPFSGEFK